MKIKRLPAGFVIPAQPVVASRPPSGPHWVHEIKHDGYRMIVRRDELTVRIYSRNAYDWTARLLTIASAAECIKAKSFTIDGEAVVLGPDGLSRLLGETKAGIVLNEHVVGDGYTVFEHACRIGAEGIVSKKVDGTYRSGPCSAWIKVRNPTCIACSGSAATSWNR